MAHEQDTHTNTYLPPRKSKINKKADSVAASARNRLARIVKLYLVPAARFYVLRQEPTERLRNRERSAVSDSVPVQALHRDDLGVRAGEADLGRRLGCCERYGLLTH